MSVLVICMSWHGDMDAWAKCQQGRLPCTFYMRCDCGVDDGSYADMFGLESVLTNSSKQEICCPVCPRHMLFYV